jgi:hydroxyacylglutathione hydrolase
MPGGRPIFPYYRSMHDAAEIGPGTVRIARFTLGPFETNCYIVAVEGSPACWLVDVGYEPKEMLDAVRAQGLAPAAIVLTHAHCDHIAGVAEARRAFPDVPVWIHGAERQWLADPVLNLSEFGGLPVTAPGPDRELVDGEELRLDGSRWRVLHTPGHSPGGIGLYCEAAGVLLAGDTLFAGSVGRHDFPGSDGAVLARSIRERLYALPEDTKVLPGHGPATTIGRERRTNPFVRV